MQIDHIQKPSKYVFVTERNIAYTMIIIIERYEIFKLNKTTLMEEFIMSSNHTRPIMIKFSEIKRIIKLNNKKTIRI